MKITTDWLDQFGSSPLTRGTLRNATLSIVTNRFIPAYAGNSSAIPNGSIPETVHPRLRGELTQNGYNITLIGLLLSF